MKTTLPKFRSSFYIPVTHKWAFHIPHVQILAQVTVVDLVKLHLNAANNFKMCYVAVIMMSVQFLVFPIKYNQNTAVEIDTCLQRLLQWNILMHYNSKNKLIHKIISMSCSVSLFLSDDSKQYATTTTAHSKCLIELFKKKLLASSISTIWENTDGWAEQYRCASALYLMSVMSQFYSIIIDHDISAPVHGKQFVDGTNVIYKRYIYQLISNVQLIGSKTFYSHILMNSCKKNNYISLAKEFQKCLSKEHRKHGVIDQEKCIKEPVK